MLILKQENLSLLTTQQEKSFMSAEKISNTKIEVIYIPLLNEGTPVFRPAKGLRLNKNIFKVLTDGEYDPEDEDWEFPPETVVICEKESMNGEELLVAKAKVPERMNRKCNPAKRAIFHPSV
jgi:hypothetical protein